jgi:hypothetical protein
MSVKQFNATYFNQDDRILLRFNTLDESEIRLWLTRFMTRHLLIAIHQLVQKNLERLYAPQVALALQEFHEEGLQQSINFQDTYIPATKFPLGEEALLVTGLNLLSQEDIFSIDFNLINQQNVNLKIPMVAAQSLAVLLDQMQKNSAWNIDIAAEGMNPIASNLASIDKNKLH